MFRKTAELVGGGGGLKFEEKSSKKNKSTPKKKLGIGSTVLCTFHSPQPNNIDQHGSRLGTGALFCISLSLVGKVGAQLLLISFATRLHGICNGSNNGMEDGGGSTHATALGLGISAPTPNFRVLFLTGRGNSSVSSSPTRLQEILKSHHLQALVTLPATSTFF